MLNKNALVAICSKGACVGGILPEACHRQYTFPTFDKNESPNLDTDL